MGKISLNKINLTGLALEDKTTNENGKSKIDCGTLWQKFQLEKIAEKISGKISDDILAVYYNYEGDYTKPFSYFIGCKVNTGSEIPSGLVSLSIPEGTYQKFIAKGKMPECVSDVWKKIWNSELPRVYKFDFEVYGEKSKNWNDAEVEIYLSI